MPCHISLDHLTTRSAERLTASPPCNARAAASASMELDKQGPITTGLGKKMMGTVHVTILPGSSLHNKPLSMES